MEFRRVILFFSLAFFVINIFSQENAIFNAIKNDVSVETNQDSSITSEQEINTFFSDWMFSFKYGVVKFHGDLSQYNFFPTYQQSVDFHELRTASSFNLLKEVNSLYSIETTFLKGQFAGLRRDKSTEDNVYFNNLDDPYSLYEGQGEKFEANFIEFDIINRMNLNTIFSYLSDYNIPERLKLEASIGLGYNVFNTLNSLHNS